MLLIESKAYVFSVGDCKGLLFRNDVIYQMCLDHLPVSFFVDIESWRLKGKDRKCRRVHTV